MIKIFCTEVCFRNIAQAFFCIALLTLVVALFIALFITTIAFIVNELNTVKLDVFKLKDIHN